MNRMHRKVVGLIGYPLKHTISPAFQQAAFDFHSLPVQYEAWETPPEDVAAVLQRIRQPDCLGMNVTIPHKQAVIAGLDEIDPRAATIGAVNTIVNEGGRLTGYNTDADGFVRALTDDARCDPIAKRVVLLGAGGAARAVAFALVWAEAEAVTIFNRTAERAIGLADTVRDAISNAPIEGQGWDLDAIRRSIDEADLVVNATSLGMAHTASGSPLPSDLFRDRDDLVVCDLVYNPAETQLLSDARASGARTLNGLPMLIYQGAAAFELWTGLKAPVGLMMRRGADALGA